MQTQQRGFPLFPEALQATLEGLLGRPQVLSRLIERLAHAGDASIYRLIPQAVVTPRSEEDIQKLLRYCRDKKLHLTFRAAGTRRSLQFLEDLYNFVK